jgi:hypothetical protein
LLAINNLLSIAPRYGRSFNRKGLAMPSPLGALAAPALQRDDSALRFWIDTLSTLARVW